MIKKGFSFTEILVVLAIMGVLASVMVPNLLSYIDKVRVNKLEMDIETFRKQARSFKESKGHWPENINFMSTNKRNPLSPWGTKYYMDGDYIIVEVPESSRAYRGTPSSDYANNGILKFFYRDFFIVLYDGAYSHKLYPIQIRSSSTYVDGLDWFNDTDRPASREDCLLFYFVHSLKNKKLHLIVEVNTPGSGNIESFLLKKFRFNGITPSNINDPQNMYNSTNDTLQITGITDGFAHVAFELDSKTSFTLRFNMEDFTGTTPLHLGYLSGDANNFFDLGIGKDPYEYIGKDYELIYEY